MDKKNKKYYLKVTIALLVIGFLLYKNPKSTGSVYAPDMAYSKAYETYSESTIPSLFGQAKEYMSSFMPVTNTFSTNSLPSEELYRAEPSVLYSYKYTNYYKNNDTDKVRAGIELKNPYLPTKEVLNRGEAVYIKQCAICHGKTGMGDGNLVVREDGSEGPYKSVPPTYADRLKTLKDGEIYHSIVYGKNMMGGYGPHIKADDRWKLVCYIKQLGGLNSTSSTTLTTSDVNKTDSTKTK